MWWYAVDIAKRLTENYSVEIHEQCFPLGQKPESQPDCKPVNCHPDGPVDMFSLA